MSTLYDQILELQNKTDDLQTQIYIVAGVFGGVCLALIITIFIFIAAIQRLKNQIKNAEVSRKIAEEVNLRRFSAYTGEEVHRKLKTATTPAPTGGEYAFNYPSSEYKMGTPGNNNLM